MSDLGPLLLVAPTIPESALVRAAVADLLADGGLEIEVCGMGPASATALCQRLEARTRPLGGLALVGWAGGLSPDLAVGDVVLAYASVDGQGVRVPCTVIELPGAKVGALLTASEPLLTPQAKSDAWKGGALAVEMEAYPLAEWARERGLPFVHARVILDPVGEDLPDLGDALDLLGRVRWGRLVRRLLSRPSLIVALYRLMRRNQAIGPVLGGVARSVVEAWEDQHFA
jgi:nucleoside phosphorylase